MLWNGKRFFVIVMLMTFFSSSLFASLTQKQVFNEFKKVLSTDEYLDNYDNEYIDFLEYLKPEQKKLATEIFNENIEDFNKLKKNNKAKVYNAILYWLATLASPKDFEWNIATKKLSSIISSWIRTHWKLSKLISFFRQHWAEYQKIADEYGEQLEKKLVQSRNELRKEQKRWEQLDNELRKEQNELRKEQNELRKDKKQIQMLKALDKLLN